MSSLMKPCHYPATRQWLDTAEIVWKCANAVRDKVQLIPCDENSKEFIDSDEHFYSEPEEHLNRDLYFKIKILQAHGLPSRFTDIYCSFQIYLDDTEYKTNMITGTVNPKWNFSQMFSFKRVTKQLIDYLTSETIIIKLWGCHRNSKKNSDIKVIPSMNEPVQQSENIQANATLTKFLIELHILKRKQKKQETKLNAIKRMIELAEKHKKKKLSLELIKSLFQSTDQQQIYTNLLLISQEKDESDIDDDVDNANTSTDNQSLIHKPEFSNSKVSIPEQTVNRDNTSFNQSTKEFVNNSSSCEII